MNEVEWLTATDPKPMLEFLRERAGDRKFRLFACACCRHIWEQFPDPANRDLVTTVENHPEGNFRFNFAGEPPDDPNAVAPSPEIYRAGVASSRREGECRNEPAYWVAKILGRGFYKMTAAESALQVANMVASLLDHERRRDAVIDSPSDLNAETTSQVSLLHEIFSNPFRPVTLNPSWLTSTITSLAQAVYDERQLPSGLFDNQRMGVLADAVEEAGCENADILGHLRSGGVHVRGCFVVDLLLTKK